MGLLQRFFHKRSSGASASSALGQRAGRERHLAGASAPADAHASDAIKGADACNQAGDHARAIALIDEALARSPEDGELAVARGSTLYEWGRIREAREWLLRARSLGSTDPLLPFMLGWACHLVGQQDEALRWIRKAVEVDPVSTKARFGLGVVLAATGKSAEAVRQFEEVLCADGRDFKTLMQLGSCKLELDDPIAAESSYRRAIAVCPGSASAWTDLGAALYKQSRSAEGLAAFEIADRLESEADEDVDNFVNLAVALADDGRIDQALSVYERNLPDRPSPRGYYGYSELLLRTGRLPEGWTHYEYRWTAEPYRSARARYEVPVWNGQDLTGRTILLHSEQGFGDSIQFLRYAALLKAQGARVVVRTIPGLESLARRVPGVDVVLDPQDKLPQFDYYIHLLSLPRVFATTLDSVPADVPYVSAEPQRLARMRNLIAQDAKLKIGLVWAGNPKHVRDRKRSVKLSAFAAVIGVCDARLYSLQKGDPSGEIAEAGFARDIVDLAPELHDFGDTCAAIEALDLVIAVDTAVLHLAGALGKPVWALLPFASDFRWLEDRVDSPWYPTMRLFRQRVRDDWSEVLDRVATELQDLVSKGSAARHAERAQDRVSAHARQFTVRGAAESVVRGQFGISETRLGLLQYRPHESSVGLSLDWYGEFLQGQLDGLTTLVRPSATIVEIGAGIGVHSVCLSRLAGAHGHLLVYEVDRVSKRVLQQNLQSSNAENVTVMRNRPAGASESDDDSEAVDDLRLARLDLMKIGAGVDGARALAGASETLWKLRPVLFASIQDDASLNSLTTAARAHGYRCFKVRTPLFSSQNYYRRSEDIFDGQVALAMLGLPEEREITLNWPGCEEIR
jgi:tetratricopeptide (TPR) repeat protein